MQQRTEALLVNGAIAALGALAVAIKVVDAVAAAVKKRGGVKA